MACSCVLFAATCLGSCSNETPEIIIYEAVNGPTKDKIKSQAIKFKNIVKEQYGQDIEISFLDFSDLDEMDYRMQMNALNKFYPSLIITNEDHEGAYQSLYSNNIVNLDSYLLDAEVGIDKETIFNDAPIDDFVEAYLNVSKSYSTKGTYSLPLYETNDVLYYVYDDIIGKEFDGKMIDEEFMDNMSFSTMIDLSTSLKLENDSSIPLFVKNEKNLILSLGLEENISLYDIENGRLKVKFENQEAKDLLTRLSSYYAKGILGSSYLAEQGANTYDPVKKFSSGDIKMFIAPLAFGDTLQNENKNLKIGIAKTPYKSTLFTGSSISLWKSGLGENPNQVLTDYSYKFMKYLTNPNSLAALSIAAGSYIPARTSSLKNSVFDYYVNSDTLTSKALKSSIENKEALNYKSYPTGFGSKEVKEALVGAFIQIALGKKDVNKAMYDAAVSVINYI